MLTKTTILENITFIFILSYYPTERLISDQHLSPLHMSLAWSISLEAFASNISHLYQLNDPKYVGSLYLLSL